MTGHQVSSSPQSMKNPACGSWHHTQWQCHGGIWSRASGATLAWVQIPALSLTLVLILGKLANLPVSQFPFLCKVKLAEVPF